MEEEINSCSIIATINTYEGIKQFTALVTRRLKHTSTNISCTTCIQFHTYVLGVSDNADATTVHSSHTHRIVAPLANVSDNVVCCGVVCCTDILE